MLPVVVVPMLNEEATIASTCHSLGFGLGRQQDGALLILVDNGSTDDTLAVAERISAESRPGSVVLVREPEQGYVPARAAGVRHVVEHADRTGTPHDRMLLIQADADTVYEPGYVEAMLVAAGNHGRGHLFEGVSIPPRPEDDPCWQFRELEALVDGRTLEAAIEPDVVVDDKVAAFILADYTVWGGHRREYREASPCDELLAETTRLFVGAHIDFAARRISVGNAQATTSSRRILENPALAFATAGFPREACWRSAWNSRYGGPRSLEAFRVSSMPELVEAIDVRRRHVLALFAFLPELVSGSAGTGASTSRTFGEEKGAPLREAVAPDRPGQLLSEAFERSGIAR